MRLTTFSIVKQLKCNWNVELILDKLIERPQITNTELKLSTSVLLTQRNSQLFYLLL